MSPVYCFAPRLRLQRLLRLRLQLQHLVADVLGDVRRRAASTAGILAAMPKLVPSQPWHSGAKFASCGIHQLTKYFLRIARAEGPGIGDPARSSVRFERVWGPAAPSLGQSWPEQAGNMINIGRGGEPETG